MTMYSKNTQVGTYSSRFEAKIGQNLSKQEAVYCYLNANVLQLYLLNSLFKILVGVFLVVEFYPWFQLYFPLFVKSLSKIYHTPKQMKIKLKLKIKILNCNIIVPGMSRILHKLLFS